jgi:hypothetical protein
MYKEKEFNNFDVEQLKILSNSLSEFLIECDRDLLKEKNNPKLKLLLQTGPPWASWYEMPYPVFIDIFFEVMGLKEVLVQASQAEDPGQMLIDHQIGMDDPTDEEIEMYDLDDQAIITSLTFASLNNLKYFQLEGISLNDLLQKANDSESALLQAITFDKTIVSTSTAKNKIQLAEFQGNTKFRKKLAKAISKERTQLDLELNDTRFVHFILEECMSGKKISMRQRYELFTDDLKVFFGDEQTFKKFIDRTNIRSKRTLNQV